jgi:hypothetical protein
MVGGPASFKMARLPTIDYRPLTLLLPCILLTTTSCANVVNYTDPAGPRFADPGSSGRTSAVR